MLDERDESRDDGIPVPTSGFDRLDGHFLFRHEELLDDGVEFVIGGVQGLCSIRHTASRSLRNDQAPWTFSADIASASSVRMRCRIADGSCRADSRTRSRLFLAA